MEQATLQDVEETKEIVSILKNDYEQYESRADTENRERILAKLNELVRSWIKEVGKQLGKDEETIEHSGGKVFTFGSYRLGVHAPNTDIDALCVAPRHVDRDKHFFGSLVDILSLNDSVKNLNPVKDAFVPRIGMEFDGIEIDLVFACIAYKEVGADL